MAKVKKWLASLLMGVLTVLSIGGFTACEKSSNVPQHAIDGTYYFYYNDIPVEDIAITLNDGKIIANGELTGSYIVYNGSTIVITMIDEPNAKLYGQVFNGSMSLIYCYEDEMDNERLMEEEIITFSQKGCKPSEVFTRFNGIYECDSDYNQGIDGEWELVLQNGVWYEISENDSWAIGVYTSTGSMVELRTLQSDIPIEFKNNLVETTHFKPVRRGMLTSEFLRLDNLFYEM